MNISKDQVWTRKKYTNNLMYYPEGGWEVKIVDVVENVVKYEVIKYKNKKVFSGTIIEKSIDEFLSMYEQS
jgi:hypothetical protein